MDNHSDDSSSSNVELRMQNSKAKHLASYHQSDSDDMSVGISMSKSINKTQSLRIKNSIPTFLAPKKLDTIGKPVNYSLESDSFNENSPARPSIRRKRKLKRMCVDQTPVASCGKRKRPQRIETAEALRLKNKIKPLNQSIVDKIEKFCGTSCETESTMEIQHVDENGEVLSESSISWSGKN